MYDREHLIMVAIKDPGTRRIDTICSFGLSQAQNVISISEDSILYQLREINELEGDGQRAENEFYWTFIQNEVIVQIPRPLKKLLGEE